MNNHPSDWRTQLLHCFDLIAVVPDHDIVVVVQGVMIAVAERLLVILDQTVVGSDGG